ncbi:MAG: hypothetical protein AAFY71_26810 [Bacteroidota bacterium]
MRTLFPEETTNLEFTDKVISYAKTHQDPIKKVLPYVGQYKFNELAASLIVSPKGKNMINRGVNRPPVQVFPISDHQLVSLGLYSGSYTLTFSPKEKGKSSMKYWNGKSKSFEEEKILWFQDSIIIRANHHLEQKAYKQAKKFYKLAQHKFPDHFYLGYALDHISYVQQFPTGVLPDKLVRFVGSYGEAKVWISGGDLYIKLPGSPRKKLLRISDNRFMSLAEYGYQYEFNLDQGVISSLTIWLKGEKDSPFMVHQELNKDNILN